MKRLKNKVFLLLFALAGFTSCQDLLEEKPSSYYDSDLLFSSIQGAQMALNGVYVTLSDPSHYGQDEMAMPTSDDMYFINGTNADNSRRDICHYGVTTTNQWIETLWKYKYNGINRANHVIDGVQKMDLYKAGNTECIRIEAQARFMRALLAFDIVRYWGDAPFKTEYTGGYEGSYAPKVSREKILDQVVEDLTFAKNNLPWATAGWNSERPSQGSARGMLMRVYLYRSGYYLPSDAPVGSDLSRVDDATRRDYFTKVTEEYQAFVANGFHKLSPLDYRSYWKSFCQKRLEPVESLFEIAFYTPDGKNNGGGTWGTYIGPLTSENSKYGRANAFFRVIPAWFTKYYETTDVRRLVNMCNYQIDAKGDSVAYKNTNTIYPGKWRREWMTNPNKDPNNVDVNFIYLRYADVMLMAAEAYNELGDSDLAKGLINQVRRRSAASEWNDDTDYTRIYVTNKLPAVATLIPDADAQGKVRRALYWERGFELCYEGVRKYDLLRWGVLEGALRATVNSGYVANTTFVKGKHELFPIPLAEIQVNSKITTNNPGYN